MSSLDYRRVYRAIVEPPRGACELTVYVEAAWPRRYVDEAIYNVASAVDCIEDGESEDLEVRLFEVGWGGGRPPLLCRKPVFLVEDPGAWARKWAASSMGD